MPSWTSTGKVRNSAWSKRVWRASGMARHRLHSVNDAPSAPPGATPVDPRHKLPDGIVPFARL